MVRVASGDRPAIIFLQEIPLWALGFLGDWSGMVAMGAVARRATIGPFPSTAEIGRILTATNHGLFRSAFTGQANAVLVDPALTVLESREIVLNPYRYRRAQAARLGLDLVDRLAWSKERRVCQSVRVALDGESLVIGNLHATGFYDKRVPDAELLRAAVFVDGMAKPGEPVLLSGDFNLSVRNSKTIEELTRREWGFTGPTPTGIDHILVRDRRAGEPHRWPLERRSVDGRLLSDHAPVEREVL